MDKQSSYLNLKNLIKNLIILTSTFQCIGITLNQTTLMGQNDISRWCTTWSLLERGTYEIDECPWQGLTNDQIYKQRPFTNPIDKSSKEKHFYSSKPPFLPTLIAGILYPFRVMTNTSLDYEITCEQNKIIIKAYSLYFKPIIILLNIITLYIFLRLYSRFLDLYAASDWSWLISLFAAAWGTPLFPFASTLNNHTISAYFLFFSLYNLIKLLDNRAQNEKIVYILTGFFAAICACNELPACLFLFTVFIILIFKNTRNTIFYFIPSITIPCVFFLGTQYLALGSLIPAYGHKEWYDYPGSYWNNPQGFDSYNEPKIKYLFNIIIGHHGIISLTPIIFFSMYFMIAPSQKYTKNSNYKIIKYLRILSIINTLIIIIFYVIFTSNYGGATQGFRWVFWLYPFWLVLLPFGLESWHNNALHRNLVITALLISILFSSFAIINPWSDPLLYNLFHILGYH